MEQQGFVDFGQTLEDGRVGRLVLAHFDERANDVEAHGGFFRCQLKAEIARKAFGVAFDRLDQGPGLDFIESGEIGIQDDPQLADTTNQGCDSRWGRNLGGIAARDPLERFPTGTGPNALRAC